VGPLAFGIGVEGQAAHFDGTSFVEIPHSPDLSGLQEFTIEAWIRPAALPPLAPVINKWGTKGSEDDDFRLHLGRGSICFTVCSGISNYEAEVGSKPCLEAGRWHHVWAHYSAGDQTMILAVDGREVARGAAVLTQRNDTTEPLRVGLYTTGFGDPPRYFEGDIDELIVWQGRPELTVPPPPERTKYEVLYAEDFSARPANWVWKSENFYWDADHQRLAITSAPDWSGNAHVRVPAPQGSFRLSWSFGVSRFPYAGGCMPALCSHPDLPFVEEVLGEGIRGVWMGFCDSDRDGKNVTMTFLRDAGADCVSHRAVGLSPLGKVYRMVTEYDERESRLTQTVVENGTRIGRWTEKIDRMSKDLQFIQITRNREITGWVDDILLEQPMTDEE
jgi:hypothetical protein